MYCRWILSNDFFFSFGMDNVRIAKTRTSWYWLIFSLSNKIYNFNDLFREAHSFSSSFSQNFAIPPYLYHVVGYCTLYPVRSVRPLEWNLGGCGQNSIQAEPFSLILMATLGEWITLPLQGFGSDWSKLVVLCQCGEQISPGGFVSNEGHRRTTMLEFPVIYDDFQHHEVLVAVAMVLEFLLSSKESF